MAVIDIIILCVLVLFGIIGMIKGFLNQIKFVWLKLIITVNKVFMEKISCFDTNYRFITSSLSAKLLKKFGNNIPTIVCLGSDKVLSDMVGILVADKLKKLNIKTYVYGGSDFVITTKNLDCLLSKINCSNILFIDSAICKEKNNIYYNPKGIKLKNNKFYDGASIGAGTIFLKKDKIKLADIGLKEIINFVNIIVLSITDYLSFVA